MVKSSMKKPRRWLNHAVFKREGLKENKTSARKVVKKILGAFRILIHKRALSWKR